MNLDPSIFGERPKNLCRVPGCTKPRHFNHTLCSGHFMRRQKKQPMEPPLRPYARKGEPRPPCSVAGCARPIRNHKHGLCPAHYRRKIRGKPLDPPLLEYRGKGQVAEMTTRIFRTAAEEIIARARELGVPKSVVARRILEDWANARRRERAQ